MIILSPQELAAYTGTDRPSVQQRELNHLGVPFKVRRDKTLIVLRVHVEGLQTQPAQRGPRVRLEA
jgi:hypothetical protein